MPCRCEWWARRPPNSRQCTNSDKWSDCVKFVSFSTGIHSNTLCRPYVHVCGCSDIIKCYQPLCKGPFLSLCKQKCALTMLDNRILLSASPHSGGDNFQHSCMTFNNEDIAMTWCPKRGMSHILPKPWQFIQHLNFQSLKMHPLPLSELICMDTLVSNDLALLQLEHCNSSWKHDTPHPTLVRGCKWVVQNQSIVVTVVTLWYSLQ